MKAPRQNYTQIPNVFLDESASLLSHTEFRVLMILCRETFGWQRPTCQCSISFLKEKSGLSKRATVYALNSLIKKKIITKTVTKTSDNFNEINYYEIVFEDEKEGEGSATIAPGGSANSIPPLVQPLHTNKESNLNKGGLSSGPQIDLSKSPQKACSERLKSAPEPPLRRLEFSIEKRKIIGITDEDIQKWKEAYPNINLTQELAKAENWLLSNPAKSKKQYRRFLNNWFSKAEDSAFMRKSRAFQNEKPVNSNVETNYKLYLDIINEHPSLISKIKAYGKSNVVNKYNDYDVSFNINPSDFKNAFYKLAGVYEED